MDVGAPVLRYSGRVGQRVQGSKGKRGTRVGSPEGTTMHNEKGRMHYGEAKLGGGA